MTFDADKTVAYWRAGTEYDLETAVVLFEKRRFPYALFFGHQALEKLLKALVVKSTREHALYTHSLALLVSRLKIELPPSWDDRLKECRKFNLEARYPDESMTFYRECTEEYAGEAFEKMREMYSWFHAKL